MAEEKRQGSENNFRPLTIAVTGASGFIGQYLTMTLMQRGHHLHLLSHRKDPDFVSPRGQVKIFQGSVDDIESMKKCFEGCDIVYHLVGIIVETKNKTFEKTVAEGTANLVRAAREAGVGKIVYLSALGTGPDSEVKYFQSKWAAENHVVDSEIDYTIFRPSIVYGTGDQFINRLARMIRLSPIIPVPGSGRFKLQPVYVEELCAVMALAAEKPETSGKTYDIGGPEQLTYLEVIDIIKRTMNRRRLTIHIPLSLVKAAAFILELIMKPAPVTRDQLKMMEAGSTCDQTVAEKEFGVKFSSLEMQLPKYMRK